MQLLFYLFLLCHFLGDFYLQTDKIAVKKLTNKWFLLVHVLLYSIPFLLFFFITDSKIITIQLLVLNFLLHYAIDFVTCFIKNKNILNNSFSFIIDQSLHIVSFIILIIIFKDWFIIDGLTEYNTLISYATAIIILVKPSSIAIEILFSDINFKPKIEKTTKDNDISDIKNPLDVGKVIGMIERILFLILFVKEAYTALGFIITIKTWARSGDFDDDAFREKYLLGTICSLCISLLISFII